MTDSQIAAAPEPAPQGHGDTGHRPRVVIIGAGFAGLSAARALAGAPVEVTVFGRHNYHFFQALRHGRADPRHSSSPGQCARGGSTISTGSAGGPPSICARCFRASAHSTKADGPAAGITRPPAAAAPPGGAAASG